MDPNQNCVEGDKYPNSIIRAFESPVDDIFYSLSVIPEKIKTGGTYLFYRFI